MISSNEKGKELENAVYLIESLIFAQNPALRESNLTIEKNKIITINEVKHEIDVYIKVDMGNSYTSTFIFECKNWDHQNVGKSEVIEFSEKIKVTNSQFGFFLAKGFGKYAKAQAKNDSRVNLYTVKTSDFDLRDIPIPGHTQVEVGKRFKLEYTVKGSDNMKKVDDVDTFLNQTFIWDNQPVNSSKFIDQLISDMHEKRFKEERTDLLDSGNYFHDFALIFKFDKGKKLQISDMDITKLRIDVTWESEITKPILKSKYSIKDRGRVVSVVYPTKGTKELHLDVVKLPSGAFSFVPHIKDK